MVFFKSWKCLLLLGEIKSRCEDIVTGIIICCTAQIKLTNNTKRLLPTVLPLIHLLITDLRAQTNFYPSTRPMIHRMCLKFHVLCCDQAWKTKFNLSWSGGWSNILLVPGRNGRSHYFSGVNFCLFWSQGWSNVLLPSGLNGLNHDFSRVSLISPCPWVGVTFSWSHLSGVSFGLFWSQGWSNIFLLSGLSDLNHYCLGAV